MGTSLHGCSDSTKSLQRISAGNRKLTKQRLRIVDNNLPLYIQYRHGVTNNCEYEGYRVRKPGFPSKSFIDKTKSLNERLQCAISYLESLK